MTLLRSIKNGALFGLGVWAGLLVASNGPDLYTRYLRRRFA